MPIKLRDIPIEETPFQPIKLDNIPIEEPEQPSIVKPMPLDTIPIETEPAITEPTATPLGEPIQPVSQTPEELFTGTDAPGLEPEETPEATIKGTIARLGANTLSLASHAPGFIIDVGQSVANAVSPKIQSFLGGIDDATKSQVEEFNKQNFAQMQAIKESHRETFQNAKTEEEIRAAQKTIIQEVHNNRIENAKAYASQMGIDESKFLDAVNKIPAGKQYVTELADVAYNNPVARFSKNVLEKYPSPEEIFGGGVVETFKKSPVQGFQYMGLAGLENIGNMALFAVNAPAGLVTIGLGAAGERAKELKDKEIEDGKRLLSAGAYGLAESIPEMFGSAAIVGRLKDAFKTTAAELGKEVAEKGLKSTIAGVFKTGAKEWGVEFAEENVTSLTQILTDVVLDVEADNAKERLKTYLTNEMPELAAATWTGGVVGATRKGVEAIRAKKAVAPTDTPVKPIEPKKVEPTPEVVEPITLPKKPGVAPKEVKVEPIGIEAKKPKGKTERFFHGTSKESAELVKSGKAKSLKRTEFYTSPNEEVAKEFGAEVIELIPTKKLKVFDGDKINTKYLKENKFQTEKEAYTALKKEGYDVISFKEGGVAADRSIILNHDAFEVKPQLTPEEKGFVKKVRPEVTVKKAEVKPEIKKPPKVKPVVEEKVKIPVEEQIKTAKEKGLKELSFPITAEEGGLPSATQRLYEPQTHKETEAIADNIIKEKGVDGSIKWLRDTEKPSAEHTNVAIKVSAGLQKQAEAVKKKSPAQSEALMERAIDVVNETATRLMRMGQEIEAVKTINSLSPDAVVFSRQRALNKFNKDRPDKNKVALKTPEAENLRTLAKDAKKWEAVETSTEKANEVLDQVLKKKELNREDVNFLREYKQNIDRVLGEPTEKVKPKTQKKKTLDTISTMLDKKAHEALERFNKRNTKSVTLHAGIPVDDMIDLSTYGAFKVAKTGVDFAKWSSEMVSQFGDSIKPHLKKVWNGSMDIFRAEAGRVRKLQKEQKTINELMQKIDKGELSEPSNIQTYKEALNNIQKLTGEAKTEAVLELQHAVETPPDVSLLRKVATAQTIAQLLNLKTLGRNILGNEMFWRIERLNKYVATPVDVITSKITGKRTVTYKARDAKGYWEGLFRGSRAAWKGYNPANLETQYDLKGQSFKGKYNPLTYLEKVMGVALRGTDFAAYNRAKNHAFAELGEIMAINKGVKRKDRKKFVQDFIKNADALSVEIAHEYGKYATFQDSNLLSDSATKLKKRLNALKDFGLGDLILKYPKTPANLLARALAYSPAGAARSLYHIGRAFRGHEFNQRAFVESVSRAIVGTAGFSAVGYMLFLKGVLTGSPEDWEIRDFKRQLTGEGPYKVNVSALKRWVMEGFAPGKISVQRGDMLITYDWAQPLAISLALGANVAKNSQEKAGAKTSINNIYGGTIDALAGGIQTIAEQPLLAGLQIFFGSSYGNLNAGEKWLKSFERVAIGAPSSFIPTLIYQIRQSTDNTARESFDPNPFKQAINRAVNKLPWFEKNLPESYKALGVKEKEIFQDGNNTLFNVFINPSFVSKYKVDPLVEIILDPYRNERRKRQLPRLAKGKLTYSVDQIKKMTKKKEPYLKSRGLDTSKPRVTFELNGREISDMQRIMAGLTQKNMTKAIRGGKKTKTGRKRFKSLSPQEQENLLANVLTEVSKDAREYYIKIKLRQGF